MKPVVALIAIPLLLSAQGGCDYQEQTSNGIPRAQADVKVGPSGMTIEQENVKRRVEEDNKPGAVKYLYVLSPYSGEIVLQSAVQGKVTSGGKRLEPAEYYAGGGHSDYKYERLQPDGTYGTSGDYLYWWDTNGVYHQHYLTGGQIVHVVSQPMAFGRVTISTEGAKQ